MEMDVFEAIRTVAAAAARLGLAGALAACEALSPPAASKPPDLDEVFPIFTAGDALMKDWRRVQVWSVSEWRLEVLDGEIVIAPAVDGSSTALGRWIKFDTETCPVAEWTWRVDALPETADLTSRDAEDVAASVIFVFGDPGSINNPDPTPTLRYVWATETNGVGTVVDSPYFPGVLRSLVVRSGPAPAARVTERRNLREDYAAAFGELPAEPVYAFALYSDNDHNREPVTAYYLDARVLCSELPESDFIFG